MRFYIVRFFLILLSSFSAIHVAAQPGCPSIDAGSDVPLSYTTSCTNLVANYFRTGASNAYSVSSIPYAPFPYNGGTSIMIGVDDKWSGILPIPFNFCFFDSSYNHLVVGSNGVVSFRTLYANGF